MAMGKLQLLNIISYNPDNFPNDALQKLSSHPSLKKVALAEWHLRVLGEVQIHNPADQMGILRWPLL